MPINKESSWANTYTQISTAAWEAKTLQQYKENISKPIGSSKPSCT